METGKIVRARFQPMKLLLRISVIIFVFSMFLLHTTCGNSKKFKKIAYEGTVFDSARSKSPHVVAGVVISLYGCAYHCTDGDGSVLCSSCQYLIGESTTDASGHFSIHGSAARTGDYFVRKPGDRVNTEGVNESGLKSPELTVIYLNH